MADDYTVAIDYLNQAEGLSDVLLKSTLQALADDKIVPMEYIMIGVNGANAAMAAYNLFRTIPRADRKKIATVLLEGDRTWSMAMPGDYSVALEWLEQAEQLGDLVLKSILQALDDNKVKPMEYIMIGINGGNCGMAAYNLFRALPPADRTKLLEVLLHGTRTWTMPALPA